VASGPPLSSASAQAGQQPCCRMSRMDGEGGGVACDRYFLYQPSSGGNMHPRQHWLRGLRSVGQKLLLPVPGYTRCLLPICLQSHV
jgi:hypothetical protein